LTEFAHVDELDVFKVCCVGGVVLPVLLSHTAGIGLASEQKPTHTALLVAMRWCITAQEPTRRVVIHETKVRSRHVVCELVTVERGVVT
jgi:hypothetical protein